MSKRVTNLRSLRTLLAAEPAIDRVLAKQDESLVVNEAAQALTIAGLSEASPRRPILVVTARHSEAERLSGDLSTVLSSDDVALFAPWGTLPFERISPAFDVMGQRLRLLWRLRNSPPSVIVSSIRALMQRLDPAAAIEPLVCSAGKMLDLQELTRNLVAFGYRREFQVEHRGEFAVRGSIVDVFPSTRQQPVRIDLWGDEVDRLTEFSVVDQRATNIVDEVKIYPCREIRPNETARQRAQQLLVAEPWGQQQWTRIVEGELFDGMESWLPWLVTEELVLPDLLKADGWIVLVEPRRLRDRAKDIEHEEADLAVSLAKTWEVDADELHRLHLSFDRLLAETKAPVLAMLTAQPTGSNGVGVIQATAWNPVVGDLEPAISRLIDLIRDGFCVVIAADTSGSAQRLMTVLQEYGIEASSAGPYSDLAKVGAHLVVAPLDRGAVFHDIKLAVLAEADLTGRRRTHRQARPRPVDAQRFFDDLREGSYVVHAQHGIARFAGMVTRAINGNDRDYLLLEYRGSDRLYVPSDQIDLVRVYNGGETPKLSKMGGSDWQASKAKVRSDVSTIAQELVVLYQKRITSLGHQFALDTPWQSEFEGSFGYQETPDQLQAIAEVKADMESRYPMDRLVIGDVGFGKTEVALRAVFKAVLDGSQAAVLVPTTLLAQQHHVTFRERFSSYPVRVEVLSRFLTSAQANAVIAGLKAGEVDVVIGTHRLLSNDVKFKKLGLLVVDEEQRFGVQHKEKIKSLRTDLDVLTLTATPIPRTMEMGLAGIRDMSLLNTAPADRLPIMTYVGEYSQQAVAEAIRRELLREGQLFFVHNRVRDIEHVAQSLRSLVPEARIAVAHGQMDEGTLERVVIDFWEGKYDVLVCTTIIESGIDMPTVNTLVVDQAERLGLGQLHQLRGRVGRAGQRAYAYLFHSSNKVLSEEAYERLKTIGESVELGSGFRIAMRDLELRGAGNLLGTGQSGHIAAVGYDLYCQMVTEAVADLRGEKVGEPPKITIDVPGDAHLPKEYVADQPIRLEAYRRLGSVHTQEMLDDIRLEWQDRFGVLPPQAQALLNVGKLRVECVRSGVREVVVTKGLGFGSADYMARFTPVTLPQSKQVRLQRLYANNSTASKPVYSETNAELRIPIFAKQGPVVEQLINIMVDLLPDVHV